MPYVFYNTDEPNIETCLLEKFNTKYLTCKVFSSLYRQDQF